MCWSRGGATASLVYMKSYASKEEALRDLGVSEDALDAVSP
jgi:hypothetical protein